MNEDIFETIKNANSLSSLNDFYKDLIRTYAAPSIINSSTLALGRPYLEDLYLANLYQKGIRRYDGTWSKPEDVVDIDFLGDPMHRISYDGDEIDYSKYNILNDLGWLGSPEDLTKYTDNLPEESKKQYEKLINGLVLDVLRNIAENEKDYVPVINDKGEKTYVTNDAKVRGRFTLAYDEEGNPYWQELLTDKATRMKLEAAGISLVNAYGPQPYQDGLLKAGVKGFAGALADLPKSMAGVNAALNDLSEYALSYAFDGKAETYDDWTNLDYADISDDVNQLWVNNKSYQSLQSIFDNLEAFSSGVGLGLGSLAEYMVSARLFKAGIGGLAKALDGVSLMRNALGTTAKTISNYLKENAGTAAMWGAGLVMNFGEGYDEAINNKLDREDAAIVGISAGIVNTIIEQYLGSNVLNKWLAGAAGTREVAKDIIKEVGGDITKLSDKAVSKRIITKVLDKVRRFTETPILGQMYEEGMEEFLQGYGKNSIEAIYDYAFADKDATPGNGKFGRELTSKKDFVDALGEGVVGAVIGGLGGFAHLKSKEDKSLIQWIAAGEYDSVTAAAKLALEKGALTQQQYDGIIDRANTLNDLYTRNKNLFSQLPYRKGSEADLLSKANNILKVLRDQDDFAKEDHPLDQQEEINAKMDDILNRTLETTEGFSGIEVFADTLEKNGKREAALMLRERMKDSASRVNDIRNRTKDIRKKSKTGMYELAMRTLLLEMFRLNTRIDNAIESSNEGRRTKDNVNLRANQAFSNPAIANKINEEIAKFNQKAEELLDKIDKTNDQDEIKKLADLINRELNKSLNKLAQDNDIQDILNYKEYLEALGKQLLYDKLAKKLKNDRRKFLNEQGPESVKQAVQTIEEVFNRLQQAQLQQRNLERQKKKQAEENAAVNNAVNPTVMSNNEKAARSYLSDAEQKLFDSLTPELQVDFLEERIAKLSLQYNNTPKELADLRRALSDHINALYKFNEDLRKKNNITKSKRDLERRYKTNFPETGIRLEDNDGKAYMLHQPNEYSENDGLIFEVDELDDKGNIVKTYEVTEKGDPDFFTDKKTPKAGAAATTIVEEYRGKLSKKQPKTVVEPEYLEPVPEEETGKKGGTAVGGGTYLNMLKGLIIGDAFKLIIANPSTDASKFYGNIVAYEYDKATDKEKEAYKLFKSLAGTTWDKLTKEQQELLIGYLPLQMELLHPNLTSKKGDPYKNYVAIPARDVGTAKTYTMDADLVAQRTNIIKILLSTGKFTINPGDIEIQPGFFNESAQQAIVDPLTGQLYFIGNNNIADIESLHIEHTKNGYEIQLKVGDKTFTYPVTIAIADQNGVMTYQYVYKGQVVNRNADGKGSPGTPYLIIPNFLNLGRNKSSWYPLKLNPRRIDRTTANLVFRLLAEVARGASLDTRIRSVWKDDTYELVIPQNSNITFGEVLEQIVFFGDKTRLTGKDAKDYLLNKLLYIKNGLIYYGKDNTIVDPTDDASVNSFLNWMTQNKSFNIDRAKLTSNAKAKNGFEVVDSSNHRVYFVDQLMGYTEHLVVNGVVSSNLDPKGPLFRGLFIRLKTVAEPVNTSQGPAVTPGPKQETKPVKAVVPTGGDEVSSVIDEKRNKRTGALALKDAIATAPEGSTITITLRNNDSGVITNESGVTVGEAKNVIISVADGKLNGKTFDASKSIGSEEGLGGVICDIINEDLKADLTHSMLGTITLHIPSTTPPAANTLPAVEPLLKPGNRIERLIEVKGDIVTTKYTAYNDDGKVIMLTGLPISKEDILESDLESVEGVLNDSVDGTVRFELTELRFDSKSNTYAGEVQLKSKLKDGSTFNLRFTFKFKREPRASVNFSNSQPLNSESYVAKLYSKVYTDVTNKLTLQFKDRKPSKTDIDNFFVRITTLGNGAAELYGFKDYTQARAMLEYVQPNGKTVKENLIEFLNKLGPSEPPAAGGSSAASIVGSVFGGRRKKGATKVYRTSDAAKKRMSDFERKQMQKILGKKRYKSIKWLDKLISITDKFGNPAKAWGIMTKSAIELYNNAISGTGYHESFHNVSLLLLTDEERNKLHEDARRIYKLLDKTNKEVEEFLADKFMDYSLEMEELGKVKTDEYKGLLGFFKRIYDTIRDVIFSPKPKYTDINRLFKDIYNGRYSRLKTDESNLFYFDNEYGNDYKVPLVINGQTLDMDSRTLSKLVSNITALLLYDNDITDLESVRKGIDFNGLRTKIEAMLDQLTTGLNEALNNSNIDDQLKFTSLIKLYGELLSKWDSVFKPLVELKLLSYGIRRRVEDDTFTIDEDLKNLINDEVVSAYEVNSKLNARAEVRMLFLALPKTDEVDAATQLPQYENPDVVWYNVLSRCHDAKSIDEMLDRLQLLSQETIGLGGSEVNPYSELRDILLNSPAKLRTLFYVTFRKHRNKFVNAVFKDTNNGLSLTFHDADLNKRSRSINSLWSKMFSLSKPLDRSAELKAIQEQYSKLYNEVVKSNSLSFRDKVDAVLDLLSKVNIIVDANTIVNIIKNDGRFADDNDNVALNRFVNSTDFNNVFGKGKSSYLQKILNGKIDVDKIDTALSAEPLTKTLAESYIKVNPSSEDDSIVGAEGNLIYAYSDHNTITSMFEDWLKNEDFVEQLTKCSYCGHSLWLSLLQDPIVRAKLGVATMLAMVNRDNYSESRGYLDISDKEDLLLKIAAVSNGMLPIPSLANKKSYYFIQGLTGVPVGFISDEKGNKLVDDTTVNIFRGYMLDEILTIVLSYNTLNNFVKAANLTINSWNDLTAEQQLDLLNSNEDLAREAVKLVENYHFVYKGGKIVLGGNGIHTRYFIGSDVDLFAKSLSKYLNDVTIVSKAMEHVNSEEVTNFIRRSLHANINATIKLLIDNGILNVNSKKKLNVASLSNDEAIAIDAIDRRAYNYMPMVRSESGESMLSSLSEIASAIANYAINTAISTIEFEKIVSGDLAFYNAKNYKAMLDDRVKRYSAVTSTKQMMDDSLNQEWVDFDTKQYHVTTLATTPVTAQESYDMMYQKYVGTKENPGILYRRYLKFREDGVNGYEDLSDDELFSKVVEDTESRLGKYLNTNSTDALVYISPAMFRKLSIMNGEWSDAKERAYQLLESDKQLSESEEIEALELVMLPLKYIHYGFSDLNGLHIPIYDKMSLATIFGRLANNTRMLALYQFMKDNDVDMVKFDSATKSGNFLRSPYLNEDGSISDLNKLTVRDQLFKYLGKQLTTDPHEVERTTLLTLFIKVAVANIVNDGDYSLDGKTVSGQELLTQYNDIINELCRRGAEKFRKALGIKQDANGNFTLDKKRFIQMMREEALNSNMPQNIIDALVYAELNKDYLIQPSVLPSLNWLHSKLIARFKKDVIDISIPGNAFYQISDYAFDLTNSYRKVVGDNTKKRYDSKLRFRNENNRMEVKLSINLFRGAIPTKYKTFEELREYILANKELFAFAYRVPTQGKNSTLSIEIVDVLPPQAGDVIFLPLELTSLTGADFDIDKMYLARYNYYDDYGVMRKVQFIDPTDYDNDPAKFLEAIYYSRYGYVNDPKYKAARKEIFDTIDFLGKVLNSNGTLDTNEKLMILDIATNYSNIVSRHRLIELLSQPVDTFDKLSSIRSYLETVLPELRMSLEEFMNKNYETAKNAYECGKYIFNSQEAIENRLLDIFHAALTSDLSFIDATTPLDWTTEPIQAIANKVDKWYPEESVEQSLTPLFPAYQEKTKTLNIGAAYGIGPMALINVFRTLLLITDLRLTPNGITQDLGITTLNRIFDDKGISILDWTSALINAHVDAAKDPYITKLNVNKYTYNMTSFLMTVGFGDSTFYLLPLPILKDLASEYIRLNSSLIGISSYERYSRVYLQNIIDKYNDMLPKGSRINSLNEIDTKDVIANIRNNDWLEKQITSRPKNEDEVADEKWVLNQLAMLKVFMDLKEYADAFSNLIRSALIDTAKFGINASLLLAFFHLNERVVNDLHFEDVRKVFDNTFLGPKLESLRALFNIFGGGILEFSKPFVEALETVLKLSGSYYINGDLIDRISNEVKTAFLISFFDRYLALKNMTEEELFFGDNTIVKRVERLKLKIQEGQYTELRDNPLLKLLVSDANNTDDRPLIFETSIMKQRDTDSKNEYTYAWQDLLEHDDDEIVELGKDLIAYAFYLGGGSSSGIYNFYDLVPYGYLANLTYGSKEPVTYNEYVKRILEDDGNKVDAFVMETVFRNGYRDNNLVLEVKSNNLVSTMDGAFIKMNDNMTRFLTNQKGSFKPFVKVRNGNNYDLYEIVGFVGNDVYEPIQLIYGLTEHYGYSHKGVRIKEGSHGLPINELSVKAEHYDTKTGEYIVPESLLQGNKLNKFSALDCYNTTVDVLNRSNDLTIDDDGNVESKVNSDKFTTLVRTALLNLFDFAREYSSGSGENISSKGSQFAKLLTNVGNNVTVEFRGTTFRNAEHAYQTWKSGEFDEVAYNSKAFKPKGSKPVNKAVNFDIMVEILTAKLSQHPELMQGIKERGGIDYLAKSEHKVFGDMYWETSGQNMFLKALYLAYENNISPLTDVNNTESTDNDPENFASTEESIDTIESGNTILSNRELVKIRPYTGNSPRIAVASEHTDPVFFSLRIIDVLDGRLSVEDKFRNKSYSGKDFAMLYLITKHDGLPLKKLLEYKIPKLIHFSITGLGGTLYEPGVMKPLDLLERIGQFIEQGLDPDMITIRIDPIIPGVTSYDMIETIIRVGSSMGIKNFRFSIMDQYSTTKRHMESLGYDYSKYYNGNSLHAKPEVLQEISSKVLEFANKYGVKLSTCAEPTSMPGISKEACLSVSAINNVLGTSIPDTATGKQRLLCSCYGGKTDLLRYDNKCASSCIYCYAHHNADANMIYYNEDGTLKDNKLTRTSDTMNINNISQLEIDLLSREGENRKKECE